MIKTAARPMSKGLEAGRNVRMKQSRTEAQEEGKY